jgi:hypothetical protein
LLRSGERCTHSRGARTLAVQSCDALTMLVGASACVQVKDPLQTAQKMTNRVMDIEGAIVRASPPHPFSPSVVWRRARDSSCCTRCAQLLASGL